MLNNAENDAAGLAWPERGVGGDDPAALPGMDASLGNYEIWDRLALDIDESELFFSFSYYLL